MNIPEISSGVYGFTGMTATVAGHQPSIETLKALFYMASSCE